MNEQEIIQGNKLIAKFMGGLYSEKEASTTDKPIIQSEEFILPKKWCVYVKAEQRHLLKDRYGDMFEYPEGSYIYSYKVNPKFACPYEGRKLGAWADGVVVLSFEQFQQYVLNTPIKQEVMKDYEFKVGDRVKCIKAFERVPQNLCGTILLISGRYPYIGVRWDIYVDGHNLNGIVDCKDGYGYYVEKDHIELISESKVDSVDPNIFPKDSYVVLLSSCTGNNCWQSIPEGYCYQLREISSTFNFKITKDINLNKSNGWSGSAHDKLELRAATPTEIIVYKALDKPYKVGATEGETKQVLLDEVARRYPINTQYLSLDGVGNTLERVFKVIHTPRWLELGIDVGLGYVYDFGTNKWATKLADDYTQETEITTPKVWRFKTKEEFIREGLWNVNGYPQGWNSSGDMNGYLGASIPSKYHSYCESNKPFSNEDGWYFAITNYTDKPLPSGESTWIVGDIPLTVTIGSFTQELEEIPIIKIDPDEEITLQTFIVEI